MVEVGTLMGVSQVFAYFIIYHGNGCSWNCPWWKKRLLCFMKEKAVMQSKYMLEIKMFFYLFNIYSNLYRYIKHNFIRFPWKWKQSKLIGKCCVLSGFYPSSHVQLHVYSHRGMRNSTLQTNFVAISEEKCFGWSDRKTWKGYRLSSQKRLPR